MENKPTKPGPGCAPPLAIISRLPVRIAAIRDEEWLEGELVVDPTAIAQSISKDNRCADIFAFNRPLPERDPVYPCHYEWENVAVATLKSGFNHWWEGLPQETRKNVRRSQRRGVSVSLVKFDDELVLSIQRIYNETPIRQGRKFWHYGKTAEQVKQANGTYLDRSTFIGALHNGELIGFIKIVMVNRVARIMQIVSLDAHTDKRPTNALLAKAIEICCEKGASHLVYGKYVYGKKENSPVTEFKRRNGFERFTFPRYYVPTTPLGRVAICCGLHKGLTHFVPELLTTWFLAVRAGLYQRQLRTRIVPAKPDSFAGVAQS